AGEHRIADDAGAHVDQRMDEHRRDHPPAGEDNAGHDRADGSRLEHAAPTLIEMSAAEEQDADDDRPAESDEGVQRPDEEAAVEQLLAHTRGDRQSGEPAI